MYLCQMALRHVWDPSFLYLFRGQLAVSFKEGNHYAAQLLGTVNLASFPNHHPTTMKIVFVKYTSLVDSER